MKEISLWWLPFVLLTIVALLLQNQIILCSDAINAINISKWLLSSGSQHYGKDFLEASPPVIMYFYMLPILLAKYVGITIVDALKYFLIVLSFASISICYSLIQKIEVNYPQLRYVILYCLVGILFFVFASQLGQREHIVIILSLPYYFLATLRLENKSVHFGNAVLIGIAAGIGFALKPYFVLVPCLVEMYLIFSKRNLLAWVRVETLVMLTLLTFFAVLLYIFFKPYLFHFLPFVYYFYPTSIQESWANIFQDAVVQFCLFTAFFYILMMSLYRFVAVYKIIFVALVGFIVAFLLTRTSWYYHVLPASSLAFLLFIMLWYDVLMKGINNAYSFWYKSVYILLVLYLSLIPLLQVVIVKDNIEAAWLIKRSLPTSPLVVFFRQQRVDNTFTCLTLRSLVYQQLTVYANGKYVGNTPNLWWLIGKTRLTANTHAPEKLQQLFQKNNFLINTVAINLLKQKPHFVLIDQNQPLTAEKFKIDILQELMLNKSFQQAWLPYHLVMSIARFQVFSRS